MTETERKICKRASEMSGFPVWVMENMMYRFLLGEKLPAHIHAALRFGNLLVINEWPDDEGSGAD